MYICIIDYNCKSHQFLITILSYCFFASLLSCFNKALLKLHPQLRATISVDALTEAMVEFYTRNQQRFTPDIAPQVRNTSTPTLPITFLAYFISESFLLFVFFFRSRLLYP